MLPSTFSFGCNRKFNVNWLEKYSWLRYSPKLDAVICGPCALLIPKDKRNDKGLLVNRPFSCWVKLSDALSNHSKHAYHREALQSADKLKTTIENPASRMDVMTSSALQSRMAENRHILRQIVHAILFLSAECVHHTLGHGPRTLLSHPYTYLRCVRLSYMETLSMRCTVTIGLQKTREMPWLTSKSSSRLSLYMY